MERLLNFPVKTNVSLNDHFTADESDCSDGILSRVEKKKLGVHFTPSLCCLQLSRPNRGEEVPLSRTEENRFLCE